MHRAIWLPAFATATAAAACATTSESPSGTRFVVGGSGLVSPVLEPQEVPTSVSRAAPSSAATPASNPQDPWIGAIGLRHLFAGDYEVGFGVCLPNPLDVRFQELDTADQVRSLGVGVWLKLDF